MTSLTFRNLERLIPGYLYLTALFVVFIHFFGNVSWVEPVGIALSYLFPIAGSSFLSALFLVITAHALIRHKRLGFWFAVLYFGFELFSTGTVLLAAALIFEDLQSFITIEDLIRISVPSLVLLLLFIALIRGRKRYRARLAKRSLRRAVLTATIGMSLTALIALATAVAVNDFSHTHSGFSKLVRQLTLPADDLVPQVQAVLATGTVLSIVAAIVALLRSRSTTPFQSLDTELQLRVLLRDQRDEDADSLGYFATRRDKGVIFADSGKSAIAFRNVMDSCLAAGDPVGPRDHWDGVIRKFLDYANQEGLAPAVVGASAEAAKAYARAGLKVRTLGDESVVYTKDFHLDHPKLYDVHHAYQRLLAQGYTARIRRHNDLSTKDMQCLIDFADHWRQHGDERGFSMALGRLGDPLDGECVFVEALDAQGETRGLLSFVPWGKTGLSLDVMRRDLEEASGGVTEFMVASLLQASRDLGINRVSLNFAFLRETIEAGEDVGATLSQRIRRAAVGFMSQKFQIEQLYRSNMKYQPQWYSRYLCWRDSSDIATIGLAIAVAEGQISVPLIRDGAGPQALYAADQPEILAFLDEARPALPTVKYPQQVAQKLQQRSRLLQAGQDPYPTDFQRNVRLSEAATQAEGTPVRTAGRVIAINDHGGVQFYRLRDWDTELQVLIERQHASAAVLRGLRSAVAVGDHIGVCGVLGTSRNGTPSIIASEIRLTSKALRPIPRGGVADEEVKVRKRYLDLITNPEARQVLRARSAVVQAIRSTLLDQNFLEVETPILQTIHGGANARPFRTHINAYNLDLYLRIAPELYLKRLMVGGVDRVFEIGRNFRNEGADATHNPEFTMLEAYQAYGDYTSMRELTRQIIINAALAANGHTLIRGEDAHGTVHEVDLAKPWRVISVHQGIAEATGEAITPDTPIEQLKALAHRHGVHVADNVTRGALIIELHEALAECHAIAPTFFIDFPTEVSPLTRQHREDPRVAEKWDLICFGAEVATAYSELIDPVVQRERLVSQSLLAAGGDPEAMEVDEDFLEALEFAMPPSGGLGMGVDRLVMMLCGKNIRQTIAFPLVKPNRRNRSN